jgi:hypothetical protein
MKNESSIEFAPNQELTWKEVSEVHRSRNGVCQRNGELISLLTDLGAISKCYPDVESKDGETLFYTGAGRRGDQKTDIFNNSLIDAIRSGQSVPLFCKLKVNCWRYMGYWVVTDSEYVRDMQNERMIWRFVLKKAAGD